MSVEWGAVDTAAFLRVPGESDDKYSRGVVSLRTGSDQYPGAAVLGAEAAWRAGAGLVRYIGPAAAANLVLHRRPETVTVDGRTDCWVIGSGTDAARRTTDHRAELLRVLGGPVPVVVDAGALDLVEAAPNRRLVLTPHHREFERMCERLMIPSTGDRRQDASALAERAGAVVLLKGAHTLVCAPGGAMHTVTEGPSWLAVAGTGDVLGGVLGAIIAMNGGHDLAGCAAAAAWLHGRAARIASGAGDGAAGHPITALDVAEALPAAWDAARAGATAC